MNDLSPCPFCGGEAEIVHIEDGENAGGSCVCCTRCMASSNVEFDRKENFVRNWNRRALPAASQPEAEPVAWGESYNGGMFFNTVSLTKTRHHTFPLYTHPTPAPVVPAEGLADYDAGLLNDFGGGDVGWWQDYLRAEIGRANEFWREQVENSALRAQQPAAPVSGVTEQEAGWQPIETAPHEELVVLGWQEDGVWKQEIALASAGERLPNGYSNRWLHGRATHWMPLPEPPALSALEGT